MATSRFDNPITKPQNDTLSFRVMFYNAENLFDTKDNPLTDDDEFLPEAIRRWNNGRYRRKLSDLSRVIVAVGNGEIPALVGLCEIENDSVLFDLTSRSPLRALNYRYVLTQSNDPRGINVGLLYQRDRFQLIGSQSVQIPFRDGRQSRDLLHVTGRLLCGDTLDVIIAHFPSRSGGRRESESARMDAAHCMRRLSDSLTSCRRTPLLLIMGDLNDYPTDKSIRRTLATKTPNGKPPEAACLYHLLARKAKRRSYGSYKHQGVWGLLDHLIVSGNLIDSTSRFYTSESQADVVRTLPFLLTEDNTYGGLRPFRTYYGMKYEGGYSDHLPITAVFREIIAD
ncbi:MAG: endonuclease [Prevotellaceae bacterium]|jgi:predicted extracellular nuclease|nr:endonuclease [Prevotellaceae bacterium]